MKKISYAGESFVTTDGVADALLRFVAALGVNHTSATVEVATFSTVSGIEFVQLVVGPASAILSRPEPSMHSDVPDPARAEMRRAIARLDAGTLQLAATRHVVYAHPQGWDSEFGGYDFEGLESL